LAVVSIPWPTLSLESLFLGAREAADAFSAGCTWFSKSDVRRRPASRRVWCMDMSRKRTYDQYISANHCGDEYCYPRFNSGLRAIILLIGHLLTSWILVMYHIYETRWSRMYKPACRTSFESGLQHIIYTSTSLTVIHVRQHSLLCVQQRLNPAMLSLSSIYYVSGSI
jgi:hypothetical protein